MCCQTPSLNSPRTRVTTIIRRNSAVVSTTMKKRKLQMSVYNTLQVLGISLTDTTPLEGLFNKSNLNIDKELDGFYEPTLFDF